MADNSKYLDELFKTTKNIGKEIGPIAKQGASKVKTLGKGAIRFLPYVDAGIYAGQGINDIRTGHPWRGAGQLGLAGLDAALDIASLLAGPEGILLKQAGKKVAKKGIQKVLQNMAKKNTLGNTIGRGVASVGLQLGIDGNQPNRQQEQLPKQEQLQQANSNVNRNNNVSNRYQYPSTSTDEFIRDLVNANGVEDIQNSEPIVGGIETNVNSSNLEEDNQQQPISGILNRLEEYYNQQKEYRRPYIEGLQNYVDNYNELARRGFNMDRYLAGIAGWSGNDNFARMMGRYNPATVEATRLDLLNKLASANIDELDKGTQVVGNAALLQQAGLPVEAALANPNMVKNISSIMNARTNAEARRYVADQTYKARMYDTYLDNKIKQEIANGRMANARYLEQIKAQNRYNVAILQGAAYGNLGNLFNTSNMLGITNVNPNVIQSYLQQDTDL